MGEREKKGFFLLDAMESPRMVTAADRWGTDQSPGNSRLVNGDRKTTTTTSTTRALGLPWLDGWKGKALRPKLGSRAVARIHPQHQDPATSANDKAAHHKVVGLGSSSRRAPIITVLEDHTHPFPLAMPRTMELVAPELKTSNRSGGAMRARSKAIAISKKRQVDHHLHHPVAADDDDHIMQTCSSMERMYDWATWTMFKRITEHRRRFPVRYSVPTVTAPPAADPTGITSDEQHENDENSDLAGSERYYEGEIFHLEI